MSKFLSWFKSVIRSAKSKSENLNPEGENGWVLSLEEAAKDALTLLAFACRNGISLKPEHMKAVIELGRMIEHGDVAIGIDAAKEQAFWEAYSTLVAEIRPVTSDSINATLTSQRKLLATHGKERSFAQKTVVEYGVYSFIVLMLIVYFHTYLHMGMTVRNHLDSAFHSQVKTIDDLFAARIAEFDSQLKAVGREDRPNGMEKLYENYKVELQFAKLRASQDEMYSWGMLGNRVLAALGMASGVNLHGNASELQASEMQALIPSTPQAMEEPVIGPRQPEKYIEDEEEFHQEITKKLHKANQLIMSELKNVVIPSYVALNQSEQILFLISEYILPLLYGLLGTCAFVLRDLANSISNVTFSRGSQINYSLRLIMGPLVGLAIGMFLNAPPTSQGGELAANSVQSLYSLNSLGLAFLAGYSVEVLFTLLDTFVVAVGQGKKVGDKVH